MRTVRWLACAVGVLFLIGTALQLVDILNLYVTPPPVPDSTNMVDFRLATQAYRVAIWPVFFLYNLSFGVAFVTIVGLGLALVSQLARGDDRGRVVILMTLGVGGILGVVGQLILIGATQVTIDVSYCDCGFKDTEIVAQIWAQMLANGASDWLGIGAVTLAAIGVIAVDSRFRRRMPAPWSIVSWLTAIGLIASVVVPQLSLGDPDLAQWLAVAMSGVLVPIWSIWLGASLRALPEHEPEPEAVTAA
jgi:hypothetical protein